MTPEQVLNSLGPAEQTAVRAALQKGYVSPEALGQAFQQSHASRVPLLAVLSKGRLRPEQVADLSAIYRHAQQGVAQSGVRTVAPTRPSGSGPRSTAGSGEGSLTSVGAYRIERELARGGMGVVYIAFHPGLNRKVALKLLPAEASKDDAERFQIEARAAARLRHPNIVGIHDIGQADGRYYLAMDLIEGESLQAKIERDGPLRSKKAAALSEKLAKAIYYAHTKSILHRDIKPQNVLLTGDGEPMLTDFGLAKDISTEETGLTVSGQAMGTPAYMPPEQADGALDRIDRRSDVYSLGATLYELLVGVPPYEGATAMNIIVQVLSDKEPLKPSARKKGIDRDLETICLKCLEKDQTLRYDSAQALAEDLRRYQAGDEIVARPVGPFERLVRRARRRRGLVAAIVGVMLVFAATVIGVQQSNAGKLKAETKAALAAEEIAKEAEKTAKVALAEAEAARDAARKALAAQWRSGQTVKARAALDRGYAKLASERHKDAALAFADAYGLADVRHAEHGAVPFAAALKTSATLGVRHALPDTSRRQVGDGSSPVGALSPDGTLALTEHGKASAALTNVTSGEQLALFPLDGGRLAAAAFSPDGRAVVYSADKRGPKPRLLVARLVGQGQRVLWRHEVATGHDVRFSPNGQLLAMGDRGQKAALEIRSAETGDVLRKFGNDQRPNSLPADACSFDFAPTLPLVVVGYDDGQAFVFNLETGQTVGNGHLHPGKTIEAVEFMAPGVLADKNTSALVTAGSGGRVVSWALTPTKGPNGQEPWIGFRPLATFLDGGGGPVRALTKTSRAALPMVAAGCGDGGVRVWTIFGTPRLTKSLWGHHSPVEHVSFSADGRALLGGSTRDGALRWDLPRHDPWKGRGPVAFRRDGELIYTDSGWDAAQGRIPWATIFKRDGETGPLRQDQLIALGFAKPWQYALSPDGETLYMAVERQYRTESPVPREVPKPQEIPKHKARGHVEAWSVRSRKLLWSEPHPLATSVAVTPDGSKVLAASSRRQVSDVPRPDVVVREASTGRTLARLPWHAHTVWDLAVSPDSTRAVSAGMDGTLAIWALDKNSSKPLLSVALDPETGGTRVEGRPLEPFLDMDRQDLVGVTACAISPDGKLVAVTTGDGRTRLWDLKTLEHLTESESMPQSQTYAVFCGFLSETVLVTAYQNGRVELVDVTTRGILRVLNAQERITHAALSPDRERLVVSTGNVPRKCHQWSLTPPAIDLAGAADRKQLVLNRFR